MQNINYNQTSMRKQFSLKYYNNEQDNQQYNLFDN